MLKCQLNFHGMAIDKAICTQYIYSSHLMPTLLYLKKIQSIFDKDTVSIITITEAIRLGIEIYFRYLLCTVTYFIYSDILCVHDLFIYNYIQKYICGLPFCSESVNAFSTKILHR